MKTFSAFLMILILAPPAFAANIYSCFSVFQKPTEVIHSSARYIRVTDHYPDFYGGYIYVRERAAEIGWRKILGAFDFSCCSDPFESLDLMINKISVFAASFGFKLDRDLVHYADATALISALAVRSILTYTFINSFLTG
jgi:hypothetical protein